MPSSKTVKIELLLSLPEGKVRPCLSEVTIQLLEIIEASDEHLDA